MASSPDSPLYRAQKYRFGIYEADPRSGELLRDGVKVKLQEEPCQVLLVMLERQRRDWPSPR